MNAYWECPNCGFRNLLHTCKCYNCLTERDVKVENPTNAWLKKKSNEDLVFKPEDFDCPDIFNLEGAAELAQAKFDEWLEKQLTVYVERDSDCKLHVVDKKRGVYIARLIKTGRVQ